MRLIKIWLIVLMVWLVWGGNRVKAQTVVVEEAEEASATATIEPVPTIKKENLTEPQNSEASYRLESVLEKQEVGRLGWGKMAVRWAVDNGVSAATIVLLLLLPLLATMVSVLHYVFGLVGYGIFMPTMIAVTFLATGIFGGLLLFALIVLITLVGSLVLRKLKLHFWPSRAINLMFITVGVFGLMVVSTYFEVIDISKISIFPVLFMIMLAEEFVRTQLTRSRKEAKRLIIGTLVLAITGAIMMNVRGVQEWVLLHPEAVVVIVVAINLLVGSYTGLRVAEVDRFKKAIRS